MAYNAILRFAFGAALAAAFTSVVGAEPQSSAPLPPGLAPLPADVSPPANPNPPALIPPAPKRPVASPAATAAQETPAPAPPTAAKRPDPLTDKPAAAVDGKPVEASSKPAVTGALKDTKPVAPKAKAPVHRKQPHPKSTTADRPPKADVAKSVTPATPEPDGLVVVDDRPFQAASTRDAQQKAASAAIAGWEAKPGGTARTTLLAWAAKAGWTVQWDAPNDFPIVAALSYGGSFESAVSSYFGNYTDASRTNQPLSVVLYRANRIVHVTPKIKGPKS